MSQVFVSPRTCHCLPTSLRQANFTRANASGSISSRMRACSRLASSPSRPCTDLAMRSMNSSVFFGMSASVSSCWYCSSMSLIWWTSGWIFLMRRSFGSPMTLFISLSSICLGFKFASIVED